MFWMSGRILQLNCYKTPVVLRLNQKKQPLTHQLKAVLIYIRELKEPVLFTFNQHTIGISSKIYFC